MDLEKYVLDNYLNKILKVDEKGKKYILEKDIDELQLNAFEKKFIYQIMSKYQIECKLDLITDDKRVTTVKDFEYGEKIDSDLEQRDVPRYATIEYDSQGNVIKEDYTKLKKFIEREFLPDNVMMTRRRGESKSDREFVGFIDTENDRRRKYEYKVYPSIQLNKLVKLQLSDREYKYVLKYLQEQGIIVRGIDSTIDQEFENYDYFVTYKNQILPEPLSKDECQEKFVLYKATKDPVIREQLILGNLRLVPYVAWFFAFIYEKDISEIESYGYEALVEAVDTYDYNLGASFSTYAVSKIRYKIMDGRKELDFVKKGDWMESFYKCRRAVEEETGKKIADDMNLAYDVVELMINDGEEKRAKNPNASVAIRRPKDSEKLKDVIEENVRKVKFMYDKDISEFVLDNELDMDEIDDASEELVSDFDLEGVVMYDSLKNSLGEAVSSLTSRERKVLELRFGLLDGETRTYEEVGKIFGVTRERVRQLEAKALRKLRHPVRSKKLKSYLDGDVVYTNFADVNFDDRISEKRTRDDENGNIQMSDEWIEEWKKVTSDLRRRGK